jgi:hypothetical protein
MYLKHQPWVRAFDRADMEPDIEWNLWSRRAWPFLRLQAGEEIVYVSGGGPSEGRFMWTARMDYLIQERYDSLDKAWKLIRTGLPTSHLKRWDLTKQTFLADDYTAKAPTQGWILAWVGSPLRWLDKPRPGALRFRPNGWAELPDAQI